MDKFIFLLCTSLSLLLNGIDSLTIINNVTVSSDLLSDVFIKEITNNNVLLDSPMINSKIYNSNKCLFDSRELIKRLPDLKVLPFFDSWGRLPSGILYGNTHSIGNFDQCLKASIDLVASTASDSAVNGQFCFVNVPIKSKQSREYVPIPFELDGQHSERRVTLKKDKLELRIGICVPDSCSSHFLTTIFQQAINEASNGILANVSVSQCSNGKKEELRTINIVGIIFFSIIGALMLASSLYDYITAHYQKPAIPVLLAFSILTNGKKIFAFSSTTSPNIINCLTGIRVITMIWIIYCHTFMTTLHIPIINQTEQLPWAKKFWSMSVLNGTISVDTFFFISGLLVAWLGFRELDKREGKLNILMMYVHRYIRLTPPVAAVLLFGMSINKLIYKGPFREVLLSKNDCNGYNWWPVLLYIPNYFLQEPRCFDSTWYLDVDFQLYILSPLLLIPMWKWGKKFAPVLLVLSLLSISAVMATYITNGYTGLISGTNDEEWVNTYTPTHTRCSPWLVGFAFGYFMHVNRQRKFHLSRMSQLIAWIGCFSILLAVVFGPHFTIKAHNHGTLLEAAFNEGWKRFSWAIALCWLTFACHFGFGGLINSFLSHQFWQPLGRLSFSLYLVHLTVIRLNFGLIRSPVYFTDYTMMLEFWSAFGIALMFALLLTLAFESPVFILEKFIFAQEKSSNKKTPCLEEKNSNHIVVELPTKTNVC